MVIAENAVKKFDGKTVLENLRCEIGEGCIYGLIGANGAGKSTFLRLVAGCYFPDAGQITVDGEPVFDNIGKKSEVLFVPDEFFFPKGATVDGIGKMYASFYPGFDKKFFADNCETLNLPMKGRISTFSKGMKRQVVMLAALACKTKYVLFDETFDGLDPVVRNHMKKLIYAEVADRNATVVLTSHNLRELEDICDHLGVLYQGGILFEGDVNNIKSNVYKVQIAFREDFDKSKFADFEVLNFAKVGSIASIIIKGNRDQGLEKLRQMSPVLVDVLPLTLEEIFIYEMEVLGYVFKENNK